MIDPASIQILADLASHDLNEAQERASKGGGVQETREPASALLVLDFLLGALGGSPRTATTDNAILKKARDEVIYEGGSAPWRREPILFAIKTAPQLKANNRLPVEYDAAAFVMLASRSRFHAFHVLRSQRQRSVPFLMLY